MDSITLAFNGNVNVSLAVSDVVFYKDNSPERV